MRDFARWQVIGWFGRQTSVVGVAIVFAVVLTWLKALESGRYDVFQRVGYWTINLVGWSLISTLTLAALSRWSWGRSMGALQRVAVATVLASAPMLAVTAATTMAISTWRPAPDELLEQLLSIWLIGGACLYICELLRHRLASVAPQPAPTLSLDAPAAAPPIGSILGERMPAQLGSDILCLHVEDHYVRVYTRRGDTLILARFGDAIEAVSAIPGLRVHRSWWVASAAVESLRRTGRTAELRLVNGVSVPISQPYLTQSLDHWSAALV